MTVKEIILNYLKDNNFDGLCSDGCGCGFATDDLFLSCDACNECEPAYKHLYKYEGKKLYCYCLNKHKNDNCNEECEFFEECGIMDIEKTNKIKCKICGELFGTEQSREIEFVNVDGLTYLTLYICPKCKTTIYTDGSSYVTAKIREIGEKETL